jgi:hypothetical protein
MTDQLPVVSTSAETPKKKCSGVKGFFAILLLTMGGLLIVGGGLMQHQMQNMDDALANDRARIRALESHIKDLEAHTESTPAPASAQPQMQSAGASKQGAADVARLQNDLAGMSAALSALQNEVKATGTVAAKTKESAQTSIAALLAFMPLRETVMAGRKFGPELAAMKNAAKDNAGLTTALSKLDACADTGVATPAALADQFIALEAPAQQAIDKTAAQSWQDRVIAELKGLISIRPLHGGGPDFAAIENDLSSGDVAAALEAEKNLPPEAQKTLEDWRARAEARAGAEQALHDISLLVSAVGAP